MGAVARAPRPLTARALLLDEMLSPAIAVGLRDLGHHVVGVAESAAYRGMPDEQVLELAALEERGVVTANIGDFVQLDAQWRAAARPHQGIVLIASKRFPPDRSFVGAIIAALDGGLRDGSVPVADQVTFL